MREKYFYCVLCKASLENKVETILKAMGYKIISALVERDIIVNGAFVKKFRSIIPGYVFIESGAFLDIFCWREICKTDSIYYPLEYSDNERVLRGKDLDFVNWLKYNDGVIKISKVIENDKKIKVIEGPLKGLEGKIVKINRKQKCVAVKLEGEAIKQTIWLSYEYI
jgi:transcriptional antiterminator NusG